MAGGGRGFYHAAHRAAAARSLRRLRVELRPAVVLVDNRPHHEIEDLLGRCDIREGVGVAGDGDEWNPARLLDRDDDFLGWDAVVLELADELAANRSHLFR